MMLPPLKSYKKELEHSYAFGVFPTLELLQAQPESVLAVITHSRGMRNEGVLKLEKLSTLKGVHFEVNDKVVERLAPKENVYAVGVFRKYSVSLETGSNHVVLVNPGDMGNMGAIIRTMLGFGVADLALVRPAADIFDPRVVRASMGALFKLRFQYFNTFDEYRAAFNNNPYPFMTDGQATLVGMSFGQPFSLVFGNESAGLGDEYRGVGTSVKIAHSSAVDSLNLPIAVSIALYEATQDRFLGPSR